MNKLDGGQSKRTGYDCSRMLSECSHQLDPVGSDRCRGPVDQSMTEQAEAVSGGSHLTASTLAGDTPERVAPPTVDPLVDLMQGDIQKQFPVPSTGVYMNEKHQYWCNGEGPVPSVTTLLGLLDKPAVGVSKAKEAARAIYRVSATTDMANLSNEDEAIRWALQEADKARDKAADLGSSVHLLADLVGQDSNAPGASESPYKGFQVSDDTIPYLTAYRGFLDRYSASSIVSSEHAVWSLNGYAGTYDLMMTLPNQDPDDERLYDLWLIDIKTSGKGPYPEWGLQLAGYRWADYIVLPGDPTLYPMPEIQRTGVLHLRPDLYPDTGWRLIEYPITYKDDFIPFLGLVELWRWKESKRFTKSRLIGRKAKAQG